jgi:hypothetical protein
MCMDCSKSVDTKGTTFIFTDDDFDYLTKDIKKAKEQEESCKNVPVLIVGLYELLDKIEHKVFNREYVTKLKELAKAGRLFIDNDDVELPMDSFTVNESMLLLNSAQDVIDENYYQLDLDRYKDDTFEAADNADEEDEYEDDHDYDYDEADDEDIESDKELTTTQLAYLKLLERIIKVEEKVDKLACSR